ncbi:MAG: hypothetical protein HYY03_08125 [Chloroflexi bacterium]|nr:hypothetical protein [Chloroflexota bacterium]
MARAETGTVPDLHVEAQNVIAGMREAVARGDEHWLLAVLQAIGRWPLAREQVGDRTYCYLIGGEAFDWLLLAERLCEELRALIPEDECEELLFFGRLPPELTEDGFRHHLGAAKYRAHLNFLYGVRVEQALQVAVQEEVHKDRLSRIWENGHVDDEVCHRIYGSARAELLREFRGQQALATAGDSISLGELTEFTYWLFRYRLNYADPAKVASDTRKGLALLQRLEARRTRHASP